MPRHRIENSIRIVSCFAGIAMGATLAFPLAAVNHEAVDDATFATTEADTRAEADATPCVDASDGTMSSTPCPDPRLLAHGLRRDDADSGRPAPPLRR